jgi:hypothetical protein
MPADVVASRSYTPREAIPAVVNALGLEHRAQNSVNNGTNWVQQQAQNVKTQIDNSSKWATDLWNTAYNRSAGSAVLSKVGQGTSAADKLIWTAGGLIPRGKEFKDDVIVKSIKDFGNVWSDVASDSTVGVPYRTIQRVAEGKPLSLQDVLPGASALAKINPGYASGYKAMDQTTSGQVMSNVFQFGQELATGAGVGKLVFGTAIPGIVNAAKTPLGMNVIRAGANIIGGQAVARAIGNIPAPTTTIIQQERKYEPKPAPLPTPEPAPAPVPPPVPEPKPSPAPPPDRPPPPPNDGDGSGNKEVWAAINALANAGRVVTGGTTVVNQLPGTVGKADSSGQFGGGSGRGGARINAAMKQQSKKKKKGVSSSNTDSKVKDLTRKAIQTP